MEVRDPEGVAVGGGEGGGLAAFVSVGVDGDGDEVLLAGAGDLVGAGLPMLGGGRNVTRRYASEVAGWSRGISHGINFVPTSQRGH